MKCVIQRVLGASVEVEGRVISSIKRGLLVLAGIEKSDEEAEIEKKSNKLISMRIFSDENGKTNLSVKDVRGEILLVSQFTLAASFKGGNRPSFDTAEKPDRAKELLHHMTSYIGAAGIRVQNGAFGAEMKVSLVNDGPFTVIL